MTFVSLSAQDFNRSWVLVDTKFTETIRIERITGVFERYAEALQVYRVRKIPIVPNFARMLLFYYNGQYSLEELIKDSHAFYYGVNIKIPNVISHESYKCTVRNIIELYGQRV